MYVLIKDIEVKTNKGVIHGTFWDKVPLHYFPFLFLLLFFIISSSLQFSFKNISRKMVKIIENRFDIHKVIVQKDYFLCRLYVILGAI